MARMSVLKHLEEIEAVPFGYPMKKKYFKFGDTVNLNHGSFGNCAQPVLKAKFNLFEEVLEFPDAFFKYNIFSYMKENRQVAAELLDAELENLVLVPNATSAINTVLRSIPLKKGDKFVYCNTIYGSCMNTLKFLEKRIGIELIPVELIYPLSFDEVVAAYVEVLDKHPDAKICFFDVVSSSPSCRIPWERLVEECRKRGIWSMVDGAHGAGLVPISLNETKPDFFTTNFHKWLMSPNSCAALYVDQKHHNIVHSMPVSATYIDDDSELSGKAEKTRFSDQFNYIGTSDYTSILSIKASYEFRKAIGGEDKIREYCYQLAKDGGELVARQLGTEVLTGKQDDIITSMVNVRVPLELPQSELSGAATFINDYLKENKTFTPVFIYNDILWVRYSGQIYLEIDDFQFGVSCLKRAIAEYKSS